MVLIHSILHFSLWDTEQKSSWNKDLQHAVQTSAGLVRQLFFLGLWGQPNWWDSQLPGKCIVFIQFINSSGYCIKTLCINTCFIFVKLQKLFFFSLYWMCWRMSVSCLNPDSNPLSEISAWLFTFLVIKDFPFWKRGNNNDLRELCDNEKAMCKYTWLNGCRNCFVDKVITMQTWIPELTSPELMM